MSVTGDGEKTVLVRQTDEAGNVSVSDPLTFTLDTVAPDAPTLALANDTGIDGDRITNDGTVEVTGLEDGAAWDYTTDGIAWTSGGIAVDGVAKIEGLEDGSFSLQIRQTDAAGNSSMSDTIGITVDTTAPNSATLPDLLAASDTGSSNTDNVTFETRPAFEGKGAEAGSTVTLLVDGITPIGSAVAGLDGSWQITADTLEAGRYAVTAIQSDEAGNKSAISAPLVIEVAAMVDGLQVEKSTQVGEDGSLIKTIGIPTVSKDRVDLDRTSDLADIKIDNFLFQLSTGLGASVKEVVPTTDKVQLTEAISDHTKAGSRKEAFLSKGAEKFLAQMEVSDTVVTKTVSIHAAAGEVNSGVTHISGDIGGSAPKGALVIDTGGVAGGGKILIDNVEFAAIIGTAHARGGEGSQFVLGDNAAQNIILGADDDILYGGGGDDRIGSQGGDDSLYGGTGDDRITGGAGQDALYGGRGNDLMRGGEGNDSLRGNSGDDRLMGGVGDDKLRGGEDEDLLGGGAGTDNLHGGKGADVLLGGGGRDVLSGGGGDDVLTGGRWADDLTGGRGVDTFVFKSVADSDAGGARDLITDFGRGQDVIDLSGIDANGRGGDGDQVFTWIADDAFTGTAGELSFRIGEDQTVIRGDLDGDGQTDLSIVLAGIHDLDRDAFIF
ncbi:Ig-like domain-containing protein [uncultured Jannaschia sp.]|uniref:Ig-like domain-containing protein n=1 Tax=uncultured Jannaschia sp. TaxID=293347 RepID=UPI002613BBEF|nr:Ig-like domain-containing protein [uncultured Jannaschia sp.]